MKKGSSIYFAIAICRIFFFHDALIKNIKRQSICMSSCVWINDILAMIIVLNFNHIYILIQYEYGVHLQFFIFYFTGPTKHLFIRVIGVSNILIDYWYLDRV